MPPQDTTNYLLGNVNAKLDLVLSNQTSYDGRLRDVEGKVVGILAALAALPKRTPWHSVAAGIGSIAAAVLSVIAILKVLNP